MNVSFLPGWASRYAVNARTPASCCQSSPGILPRSEPFMCTTSSCEIGRTKFSEKAYISENVMSLWWNWRNQGSSFK